MLPISEKSQGANAGPIKLVASLLVEEMQIQRSNLKGENWTAIVWMHWNMKRVVCPPAALKKTSRNAIQKEAKTITAS